MKDEVLEIDEADEAEDADTVDEAETEEDDLEYDEDGNIVIPEDEEDNEQPEEEEDGEDAEADEDEGEDDDGEKQPADDDGQDDEEEKPAEKPEAKPDDGENARLKARVAELESQAKDTLKRLGAKEQSDVLKGLAELAAEAEGLSTEDYQKQRAEADRKEQAESLLLMVEFEKVATADLSELKSHYPELRNLDHVRNLPDGVREKFAKYRDMGLPAKDAYAAANPDGIRNNIAEAVKKQEKTDSGKSHLRSSVPKRSTDSSVTMSRAELAEWREMFPHKSDREIMRLYKQTAEKE